MPDPRSLRVRARAGDYDVLIGPGVRSELRARMTGRAFLVTDENVARHWGETFRALLRPQAELVIPAGEASKSLVTAERIWRFLAGARATRADALCALGGGVVGDVAGFAAATFHRGMRLVQLPTTLLAQVDSSIGGKVGIDLPEGKNLVGAFHPPALVVSDTELLQTLPAREVQSGMAELLKTALIGEAALFSELEGELAATPDRIARAAAVKAAIVSRDEHEGHERMVLNFGHTIGHALEAATGFGPLLHGEAVAVGMRAATALSTTHGRLPREKAQRIQRVLGRFNVPRGLPLDRAVAAAALRRDKKGARFILLEDIGRARVVEGLDLSAVDAALATALGELG